MGLSPLELRKTRRRVQSHGFIGLQCQKWATNHTTISALGMTYTDTSRTCGFFQVGLPGIGRQKPPVHESKSVSIRAKETETGRRGRCITGEMESEIPGAQFGARG